MAETYRPPQGVRDEAKRALEWIADGKAGSGFTDTGRKRAADLAAGRALSAETVLRMYSFLKRHEVNKSAEGFNAGEEGFPSPGRVAWSAWGGEPGLSWSTKIRNQLANRSALLNIEEGPMDTPTEDRVEHYEIVDSPVIHGALAADAAISAAQMLIANHEDPIVKQAYLLICAADAALNEALDALEDAEEIDDEDDEDDEDSEEIAEDSEEIATVSTGVPEERATKENPMIEERKAAIATAERITMATEVRAMDTEDGSLRIAGYAATFNKEASGLTFREVIAPGAFKRTLASDNPVFLLVNHDTEQLPLASTQSGTLRLAEDEVGLRMEADLDPDNPRAQELASALKRGDVDKMSFAFTVAQDGEDRKDNVRTLTDLNLFEVSVVTWPAYDSTSVGMRSAQDDIELRRRKEALKLATLRLRSRKR